MEMFIADTHLGHESILSECRPQFSSVDEMDETIIRNINRRMTRKDTLYIVGDFSFRSRRSPIEYLEAIKPKKVLIRGNHDKDWLRHMDEGERRKYFVGIHEQYSIKKNGIELHFNHFPQLAWNRSHFFAQTFMICGHIHDRRDGTVAARLFSQVPCQFNAGVDVNHFEPVTLEELVENNDRFYGRVYTDEEQALLTQGIQRFLGHKNSH